MASRPLWVERSLTGSLISSHSDKDDIEVIVMSEEESEDPDTDDAVWSGEEIAENQEVWSLPDGDEWEQEKPQDETYPMDDYF